MKINLELDRKLFVDKFFPYLFDYSHRWECFMGGAGSAKSYFITQKLIIRACREKIRILVCRRYATTIRQTIFALFKRILQGWKLTKYCKINESDFRISFPNGSEIIFTGLDQETKLLSLENIGTVFIEEAFEVSENIVEQLNLRMRGQNEQQQIIMAWNPISKHHWLYNFCQNPPESFIFIHSTYKDNPFLPRDYVKSLDELRERNPQKARVFCDGEWGVESEGLVFSHWRIEDFNEQEIAQSLGNPVMTHRAGLDFGFIDPTAIIDSLWDKENKRIYVFNEFYKTGCQLEQVLNQIK